MQEPAQTEDRATELFFQLASVDRKHILSALESENLHLNEVAKRLGMTATETLRQLQRMTDASLLEKMPDGRYRLTPYARIVMNASAPLDFISRFREFFMTHDAMLLPAEFRARLSDLSGGLLISDTMDTMNKVTEMLRNTRERIDGTVELGFELHLEIMKQRLADGVKVRWLMQESYLPKAKDMLRSVNKYPEMRHTPRLLGHIYQTDGAASVALRLNNGTMDLASFHGEDPPFLRWASDLFNHEWQKAKPWYP
jgi:predicted transcriptional regulator